MAVTAEYLKSQKVDGAFGMSSWRNRRAPSLVDYAVRFSGHFQEKRTQAKNDQLIFTKVIPIYIFCFILHQCRKTYQSVGKNKQFQQ